MAVPAVQVVVEKITTGRVHICGFAVLAGVRLRANKTEISVGLFGSGRTLFFHFLSLVLAVDLSCVLVIFGL